MRINAFNLDKWVSLDDNGNINRSYELALNQIISVKDMGFDGMSLGLNQYFDYASDLDEHRNIRNMYNSLINSIYQANMEPFYLGPSLLKHPGRANRTTLHVNRTLWNTIGIQSSGKAESNGFLGFNTALPITLNGLPNGAVAKINVFSGTDDGWFYIDNTSQNHIVKYKLKSGKNELIYIKLDGINVFAVYYRGKAGDRISISSVVVGEIPTDCLDVNGDWIGNKTTSFFHCRTPNLADRTNFYSNFHLDNLFPTECRQINVTDELNSPIGHDEDFKRKYPNGWAQALGEYIESYANFTFIQTGYKPIMFMTDPREFPDLQLRNHRTLAPIKYGTSPNYLDYISSDCPFTLFLWGEGGNINFWKSILQQTNRFKSRMIGVYSGLQRVEPIIQAMGMLGLNPNDFDWSIFYWRAEYKYLGSTLDELESFVNH